MIRFYRGLILPLAAILLLLFSACAPSQNNGVINSGTNSGESGESELPAGVVAAAPFKIGVLAGLSLDGKAESRLNELLEEFKTENVDVIVLCGNIVSGNSADDYGILGSLLQEVFGEETPDLVPVMGLNEWLFYSGLSENAAAEVFTRYFGLASANYFVDIEDFRFICISGGDMTGYISDELAQKIDGYLQDAKQKELRAFVAVNSVFNGIDYKNAPLDGILETYEDVVLIDGARFVLEDGTRFFGKIIEVNGEDITYRNTGIYAEDGETENETKNEPETGNENENKNENKNENESPITSNTDITEDIIGCSNKLTFGGFVTDVHSSAADRSFCIAGKAKENFYPEIYLESEGGFYDLSGSKLSFNVLFLNAAEFVSVYIYFEDESSFGVSAELKAFEGESAWLAATADFGEAEMFFGESLKAVTRIKLLFNFDTDRAAADTDCKVYIDNIAIDNVN